MLRDGEIRIKTQRKGGLGSATEKKEEKAPFVRKKSKKLVILQRSNERSKEFTSRSSSIINIREGRSCKVCGVEEGKIKVFFSLEKEIVESLCVVCACVCACFRETSRRVKGQPGCFDLSGRLSPVRGPGPRSATK